MRRKRARTIYWVLVTASLLMAVFGPRLGGLQSTTALAFVPVSHPANRLSNWLAFAEQPALDPASPEVPRELAEITAENERLRHRMADLQTKLAQLQQIHEDRRNLGAEILPRCTALTVVGGDGDVLQALGGGRARIEPGMPALHYGREIAGMAGIVSAATAAGAQVRLISDPSVRIEAVFARFDASRTEWVTLSTAPPLVEGAGGGLCQVARAAREDLEAAGLAQGDWALVADASLPIELQGYRIGQVTAIIDIPDEPGFARVLIKPAAELRRLKEVMIFRGER